MIPRIALFGALLGAIALVHRAPQHRPMARAILLFFLLDVLRLFTRATTGLRWQVDVALTAGWYAITLGAVLGAFTRRWGLSTSAAWIGWASLSLVLLRSGWRGDTLSEAWRCVFFGALAVQVAAFAIYLVHARWHRRTHGEPQRVAILLVCSSVADLAGPWLCEQPIAAWGVTLAPTTIFWGGLAGFQIWRWRRLKPAIS